jgi:hypothetical protein
MCICHFIIIIWTDLPDGLWYNEHHRPSILLKINKQIIFTLINFLTVQMSSWREASQIWYREMLSVVTLRKPQSIRELANGTILECVCGSDEDCDKSKVCCSGCGRWQHAQCVGFKQLEGDRENRTYCCPQCWQAQVL